MEIDQVVTLANGKKYLLLLNSELSGENYFLSVLVDDDEIPTKDYMVLKEITKDGDTYCQKINNPEILNNLLIDYQVQYDDEYSN